MKVWFLNVGHGDCTIIEHASGRITMIDINNSQDYDPDSKRELIAEEFAKTGNYFNALINAELDENRELTDPVEFVKNNFPGRSIFRFILTHPDLDHMRGLSRLFEQVPVLNFWDTANTKPTPRFRSQADKEDWDFYQNLRAGYVSGPDVKYYTRGAHIWAVNEEPDGRPGGDGIFVLSPTPALVGACNAAGDWNDLSIVLRVSYAGRSFIFPGDAEWDAWEEMVDVYGDQLKSDVLKASHHGRDSGYHLGALQKIDPIFSIISVGRKPNTDAHRKYSYHSSRAISTRRHGNIQVSVNPDGSWQWTVDRNSDG